jgi:hypothetical protein
LRLTFDWGVDRRHFNPLRPTDVSLDYRFVHGNFSTARCPLRIAVCQAERSNHEVIG